MTVPMEHLEMLDEHLKLSDEELELAFQNKKKIKWPEGHPVTIYPANYKVEGSELTIAQFWLKGLISYRKSKEK